MKTNYVKAKIDQMEQNSKCWLLGDRKKTVNPIISECIRLAQKDDKC